MTTIFIGIREFRQNISKLYKAAQKKDLHYIVLNKNKPIFEMRPLSLEDASLERLMAITHEAREDSKARRIFSLESLEKELGIP